MMVVHTTRATAAKSWLAMPNMGQMVEMDPDEISQAQHSTMNNVVSAAAGVDA